METNMSTRVRVLISLGALAFAFALGRYTVPTSTKEETKTAQTDTVNKDIKNDTDKDEHTKTIITDKKLPNGTEEKTTVITNDKVSRTKTDYSIASVSTKTSDQTKEVKKESGHLTISALAGTKISFSGLPQPDYGAMVSRDLIGPINVGLFGFSNGFCGVSLGLTF